MCGHLEFAYEVQKKTAPNWITLNQTMWSQTKACTGKSCVNKRENTALLNFTAIVFFFWTLFIG